MGEDRGDELLFFQSLESGHLVVVGDEFVEGDIVVIFGERLPIEGNETGWFNFVEEGGVLVWGDIHFGTNLFGGGRATEILFDLVEDFGEFFPFFADGSWGPVHAPDFVVDGAADVESGVSGEGLSEGGIKLADSGEEAMEADAVEVIDAEDGREEDAHPIDRGFNQREVGGDESILVIAGVIGSQSLDGGSWNRRRRERWSEMKHDG